MVIPDGRHVQTGLTDRMVQQRPVREAQQMKLCVYSIRVIVEDITSVRVADV
jgi:hypothetical protein